MFAILVLSVLGQIKHIEPLTMLDGNSTSVIRRETLAWRREAHQKKEDEALRSKDPRGLKKLFNEVKKTGPRSTATIAFYLFHDSAVAVSKNGRVQCVLELERYFNDRYFNSIALPAEEFRSHWLEALQVVRSRCDCDDGIFPKYFQNAIVVGANNEHTAKRVQFPNIVEEVLKIGHWHVVDHHAAHAALAFYGSSLRSAIVLCYDAQSVAYYGRGMELRELGELHWNFAHYKSLAVFMPEVSGLPEANTMLCEMHRDKLNSSSTEWVDIPRIHMGISLALGFAGKLMGYAGTANATDHMTSAVANYLNYVSRFASGVLETKPHKSIPLEITKVLCGPEEGHRSLAASIQKARGKMVLDAMQDIMKSTNAVETVDGISLSGGCALNVVVNQELYEKLDAAETQSDEIAPLAVHVPVAPNDAGLTVGALWAFEPPMRPQALQYKGFRLFDEDILDSEAEKRGAQRISQVGGVNYVAELLAGGPAWTLSRTSSKKAKPIIAVVRGRQEFGPRALGHRSLLAVPDSVEIRDRLNRVKARKWYRPVAPMIAEEALQRVFGKQVHSPYMSMAPKVQDEVRAKFPAMVHFDGTARHQSVSKNDEPWIHSLLHAVASWTGLAVLINTSFNSKGDPIVNTVKESLRMLDELPDLDYVIIEDYLFKAPAIKKTPSRPTERPLGIRSF